MHGNGRGAARLRAHTRRARGMMQRGRRVVQPPLPPQPPPGVVSAWRVSARRSEPPFALLGHLRCKVNNTLTSSPRRRRFTARRRVAAHFNPRRAPPSHPIPRHRLGGAAGSSRAGAGSTQSRTSGFRSRLTFPRQWVQSGSGLAACSRGFGPEAAALLPIWNNLASAEAAELGCCCGQRAVC